MAFKQAERKFAKIKIALTGISGGGKTYSALRLATGMGGKIGVADTENSSASLYADEFNFFIDDIKPPYTTEKYIECIKTAEEAGLDILIIDSISHAWAGDGGILREKERIDAKGGNSFTNWGKLTPKQESFLAAILNANIHIIVTMRCKQAYVMEENKRGKQAPVKVGLAPIQREGIEYEFSSVLEVDKDHVASVSKDRTKIFTKEEEFFQITEGHGEKIMDWLRSGKQLTDAEIRELKEKPIRKKSMDKILNLAREMTKNFKSEQKGMWMYTYLKVRKFDELKFKSIEELEGLIRALNDLKEMNSGPRQDYVTTDEMPF